jgi:glycosyltransferase involved in cell wall biosynthesis
MNLSIVIPVYNEEENVGPLIQEINEAVGPLGKPYEIVVVDDGSRDATFTVLTRLHRQEACLRVVRLKRNFGQTAAIAAGLTYAGGDVVVLMDGDAQNDPKDIPALLAELKKGNDLVCGWRFNRRDPFLHRRLPSLIANRLISWTTQVKLHDAQRCRQKLETLRRDASLYSRYCL